MIKALPSKDIDRTKWDACISKADCPQPYANSWILDIVCPEWEALVMNDYEAVMPLTWGKKLGMAYLYPVFPLQQLGVFAPNSNEHVAAFMEAIPERFKYIEYNLNEANTGRVAGFEWKEQNNCTMSLADDHATISGGYSQNLKRSLKKAVKQEVVVRAVDPAQVIDQFKATKGKEISDLNDQDYEALAKVMTTGMEKGSGTSLGAFVDDEIVASSYFLHDHGRIIFLKGSATERGKGVCGMHLIMDHMIKLHAGSGMTFDFAGSNIPSLARFYRSFGASDSVYLQARRNKLPGPLKLLKR